jgi:hypothetical protein
MLGGSFDFHGGVFVERKEVVWAGRLVRFASWFVGRRGLQVDGRTSSSFSQDYCEVRNFVQATKQKTKPRKIEGRQL